MKINLGEVVTCRVCNEPLEEILDFGMQPLGNGFISDKSAFDSEYKFHMKIGFSETSKMLQLIEQPQPEKMFHDNYAFFSGTSTYMKEHFKQFANDVMQLPSFSAESFVVELGCNDGIMLKHFSEKEIRHLGIEPSKNVAAEANLQGVETLCDFFSEDLAGEIAKKYGQVDFFLAANVMCHIPNIVGVVAGIDKLMKSTGIVMFEDPYLGDIVAKTSYDQIYDEHVFLFSAHSIQYLFGLHGFELIDLIPQLTHGGSMRYVLARKGVYPIGESVLKILKHESMQGLDKSETFRDFSKKVQASKRNLVELLTKLKSQGKRVVGYAATSKSTTIINYCGIGPELIDWICDTTPIKQGCFSPGGHIPVVPYDRFKAEVPDYAFLFAWNHADEIMAKEGEYMAAGGKWITHVPDVRILD